MTTGRILINRFTNEMIHTIEKIGSEKFPENTWFECDEMIAPAIVALNKKGYETIFSCSGHIAKDYIDDDCPCNLLNELYVVFKKTNPNKNLYKLLSNCSWDLLDSFIIEKSDNPNFLFEIRHEYKVLNSYDFVNDTHQIAEIFDEYIDINKKFYSIARKLPHKRQLNKSMHGKRMPYFKNLAENTRNRHDKNIQKSLQKEVNNNV